MAEDTATTDPADDGTTVTEAEPGHEEPTPNLYVRIAAVLFVLTAMEFSTYFIDFGGMSTLLLLLLMSIKFVLVAGFFMHLKFDTRIFTRLMSIGLVGALTLYLVAVVVLAEVPRNTGL